MDILVACAAGTMTFVLGGMWYGPQMFLNAWTEANGGSCTPSSSAPQSLAPARKTRSSTKTADKGAQQEGHGASAFIISFMLSVASAYALQWYLPRDLSVVASTAAAAQLGALFVATSFGINYAFAGRKLMLWAIDAGYHVVQFAAYGLVIGAARQYLQ